MSAGAAAAAPGGDRRGQPVEGESGRFPAGDPLKALRGPGYPLAMTLVSASVLLAPCLAASVRVGNDEYLRLPVGVRRACRLVPGDRVLLVADPPASRLLLHPPAALDALLDAHHTDILRGATP